MLRLMNFKRAPNRGVLFNNNNGNRKMANKDKTLPPAIGDGSEDLLKTIQVLTSMIQSLQLTSTAQTGMIQSLQSTSLTQNDMAKLRLDISERLNTLSEEVSVLKRDISDVSSSVKNVQHELDRQGRRLAAIESHPPFPYSLVPSNQFRATVMHSATLARREKVGYAG